MLLCWRCLLIRTDTDAHCACCSSQFAFSSKSFSAAFPPVPYSSYSSPLPTSFPSPLLPFTTSPHFLPDLPPRSSGRWESRLNGPLGIRLLSLDSLCSHPRCSSSSTAACSALLSCPSRLLPPARSCLSLKNPKENT